MRGLENQAEDSDEEGGDPFTQGLMVSLPFVWSNLILYLNILFSCAIAFLTPRCSFAMDKFFSEVRYSEMVRKRGFRLGVLDLGLLALAKGCDLAILFWDDSAEVPAVRSVLDIMESYVPTHVYWEGPKPLDLTSSNLAQWIVVACKATLQRAAVRQLDHFFPVWTKAQLSTLWDQYTQDSLRKVQKSKARAEKRLDAGKDDSSDEEMQESLRNHLGFLELKEVFLTTLHSMDLHLQEVPADDNCAIWSVLRLLAGPQMPMAMQNEHKMMAMREEGPFDVF